MHQDCFFCFFWQLASPLPALHEQLMPLESGRVPAGAAAGSSPVGGGTSPADSISVGCRGGGTCTLLPVAYAHTPTLGLGSGAHHCVYLALHARSGCQHSLPLPNFCIHGDLCRPDDSSKGWSLRLLAYVKLVVSSSVS